MKKIIAFLIMLVGMWVAGEPANGNYGAGWAFGEGVAIGIIVLCVRVLDTPDHLDLENEDNPKEL